MAKRQLKKEKLRLEELDDHDIPTVENSESIEDWERKHSRGFWGNAATGYIYDKDLKN